MAVRSTSENDKKKGGCKKWRMKNKRPFQK
jgi:hypothetical protein